MASKREIIEELNRDELQGLVQDFEVEVADRRKIELLREAAIKAKRFNARDVLERLSRDRLKELCRAFGLDDGGREKEPIVNRILGEETKGAAPPPAGDEDAGGEGAGGFSLTSPQAKPAGSKKVTRRAPAPSAGTGDTDANGDVRIYKHDHTRPNNPPVGLGDFDRPPPQPKKSYAYDPHLDPQLQWAGKAERTSFDVETVSLHIHEHVSTEAIIRAVRREEAQRSLFAQIELPPSKEVEFYKHEIDWKNRLVLGDSLTVMNSLLEREHMAGKVQCIYMDPPYGVKFNSNFQPFIHKRDVKDGDDASLTREPEQIQAYRDTWELGVHSYLSYLRDRLLLARDLLAEEGSVFVQISDENVHHVREIMSEVFGVESFVSTIVYVKTTGQTVETLAPAYDSILWYAKDRSRVKYRELFLPKEGGDEGAGVYTLLRGPGGERRRMSADEREDPRRVPPGWRIYRLDNMTSQSVGRTKGEGAASWFKVRIGDKDYTPGEQSRWKTNEAGMTRLLKAQRAVPSGVSLAYVRFLDDFPVKPLSNVWTDTGTGSFTDDKVYVVQTGIKAIQRCLLMTTDPGDIVLDPTCGSGTTAYVAEQWGRRWITCDTSRVALALARQRLLTAKFPFYRLRTPGRVRDGFHYKTVPHITLKSIAQNERLDACTTQEERERVIRDSAEQETLYDQPEQLGDKVRVTGPFTVEAIPMASLGDAGDHEDAATDVGPDAPAPIETSADAIPVGAEGELIAWLTDKVRTTGVYFPNGKHVPLPTIRPVRGPSEWLHAEAEMGQNGSARRVAVSFAPRSAPVTPHQVREALGATYGYQVVLFIGFALDPEAGKMIAQGVHGRELFYANAAPDLLVGDLLKTKKTTRLFSVFGQPDVLPHWQPDGTVQLELLGMDIYDPHTGETHPETGENVAAWFVDHDYDGKTFCICQALFPARGMKNPWEKLQKALKGSIDEETFEQLRSTRSLPFKPGKRIAVKVIDARGNEVIQLLDSAKARRRVAP
jgi:adenine-specific DNA-methyltransferase